MEFAAISQHLFHLSCVKIFEMLWQKTDVARADYDSATVWKTPGDEQKVRVPPSGTLHVPADAPKPRMPRE